MTWLHGKRTYIAAAVVAAVGLSGVDWDQVHGFMDGLQSFINAVKEALLAATLRAGVAASKGK